MKTDRSTSRPPTGTRTTRARRHSAARQPLNFVKMLAILVLPVLATGCYTQYRVVEVPVPAEPQPDRVITDQIAGSDSVKVTKIYYDEEGNEETVIEEYEYHPYRYRRYFEAFSSPYWYAPYAWSNPVYGPYFDPYYYAGWSPWYPYGFYDPYYYGGFSFGVSVGFGWGFNVGFGYGWGCCGWGWGYPYYPAPYYASYHVHYHNYGGYPGHRYKYDGATRRYAASTVRGRRTTVGRTTGVASDEGGRSRGFDREGYDRSGLRDDGGVASRLEGEDPLLVGRTSSRADASGTSAASERGSSRSLLSTRTVSGPTRIRTAGTGSDRTVGSSVSGSTSRGRSIATSGSRAASRYGTSASSSRSASRTYGSSSRTRTYGTSSTPRSARSGSSRSYSSGSRSSSTSGKVSSSSGRSVQRAPSRSNGSSGRSVGRSSSGSRSSGVRSSGSRSSGRSSGVRSGGSRSSSSGSRSSGRSSGRSRR